MTYVIISYHTSVSVYNQILLPFQWKKKLERQKATKRFRAAGSIAKLCIQMFENVSNVNDNEDKQVNETTEDEEGNVVPVEVN